MSVTMAPKPKPLLSMMGAAEAATGLVLAVAPSFLVELLLGAAPGTAAGTTVSRVAGAAILALGVACWLARQDAASRAASGLIAAMLREAVRATDGNPIARDLVIEVREGGGSVLHAGFYFEIKRLH